MSAARPYKTVYVRESLFSFVDHHGKKEMIVAETVIACCYCMPFSALLERPTTASVLSLLTSDLRSPGCPGSSESKDIRRLAIDRTGKIYSDI